MSASAEALIAAEAAGAPGTEVPDDSFGPAVVLNAMSTGSSESGSDAHNDADGAAEGAADGEQPHGAGRRKTLTRFCVSRVLWKLALACMVYLAYTRLDMVQRLEDMSAWVETLPPNYVVWVFLLMSTTFTALSPTGYLPTVLAGIVFTSRPKAWAVAYAQVNLGALLNAVLVRRLCRPLAQRMTRRRFGTFHWLNNALRQPGYGSAKVVALIRTPFLWGGFFNYLFALSDVALGPYAAGNAVGFVPGTLLFSSLGHQARQLHGVLIYSTEHSDEQWILIAVEAALTLMVAVALGIYFRRIWTVEQERFGGTKPSATELE